MQRINTVVVFFALLSSAFVIPAAFMTQEVKASLGETDDYGYYWVDSNGPEPAVQYSWIDATTSGRKISDRLSSSYSYTEVDLPFNFTFYGVTYDSLYVMSKGYVSFVDTIVSSYGTELPDGSSPNGIIAVYWNYPYFYTFEPGVWVDNGTTADGVEYFVVEWYKGRYDLTYELILYETGEIKLQYKDVVATSSSYSNGKGATVGIENEDGTIGLTYSYNQEVISNNLAILFSPYKINVTAEITDGDGDGHIVLAGYRYYNLHIETHLDGGISTLKNVRIFFDNTTSYLSLMYARGSGLLNISAVNPDATCLLVDVMNSSYLNDGVSNWTFDVRVMFTPQFPVHGNISLKAFVQTYHAGLGFEKMDDVLFMENQFYLVGEMKAYVDMGSGWEYASYNAWVRDRIPLMFTGQKIVYNCTLNDTLFSQPVAPPNNVFYFSLTDEDGVTYYDNSSSGREYNFLLNTGKIGKVKVFTLTVGSIPASNVFNLPKPYLLRVDDDIPAPPSGFVIHADSFRDPRTDVDNDDELFLTWVKTVDPSSGILGYYINDTFNITNPQGVFISPDNDRFIWNRTEEGEYNLFIWAEDRVGHYSTPVRAKILIDKKEVSFYGFVVNPIGEGDWVKSTSPVCMIKVKDYGGSGVLGDSIEYQYSPSGMENMTDWIPADLFGVKQDFTIEVHPELLDGEENYIRFRAKDAAGNGYTYSELFKLKVDSEPVAFREIFPGPTVWWPTTTVTVNVTVYDMTSGVDTGNIYYRYSINNGNNWTEWMKYTPTSEQILQNGKIVHVSIPLELPEGDQNLIQFKANDLAGNGVVISENYRIKINTKPDVKISSPVNGEIYYDKDVIAFDASETSDYDGDSLTFTWYDNDRVLSDRISFETQLPVGEHRIRLEVYDGVHTIVKEITIRVNKTELPPPGVDSDGDGIDDRDEIIWHLDPHDSTDANIDSDGDGFTNIEEVRNGTDPLDPQSVPPFHPTDQTPEKKVPMLTNFQLIIIVVLGVLAALLVAGMYSMMLKKREREELVAEQEEYNMLRPENIQATLPPPPFAPPQEALPEGEAPPPEGAVPPEETAAVPPGGEGEYPGGEVQTQPPEQ